MRTIIFGLLLFTVIISCQDKGDRKKEYDKNSYETTKEDLLSKEKKKPESFITVSGHNRRNLIGQTVVKGMVTNRATVAIYKDVDVKMEFYSKTGTLLETDHEVVFEILTPGQSKNFKTKYFAPKGTDSVALQVVGAKLAN